MNGGERGVVGSSIVGKWVEAYERTLGREKELKEELRKIDLLLEEAKKARYLIDTEKMRQQRQQKSEELKAVQQKRLKLEWMAINHIKNGDWDPEILREYEFINDLLLLNRIREEQTKEICQGCNECRVIRVKTSNGEIPLEAVTRPDKACSLPYLPYYSVKEIWETKKQLQMKVKHLGPLTPEERVEAERWVSQRLALYKNLLNGFLEERRRPLSEKVLKTGCTRRLPKLLPTARSPDPEIDGDPKAPDHFTEDVVAEPGEDGSFAKIYLSSKHGSEESE
jgi:hypothetical protein